MTFVISWIAGLFLKRGMTRAASATKPIVWVLIVGLACAFAYWRYAAFKAEIYAEAELRITSELNQKAANRLEELAKEVRAFNAESTRRADDLDARQQTFSANTALILAEIKSGKQKVSQVSPQGNCIITPQAVGTWNELQRRLQESNGVTTIAPAAQLPTVVAPTTSKQTPNTPAQTEAMKKWNDLQKRLLQP